MDITFDFACQDDCLDRMVPSDLRALVRERDDLRAQLAAAEKRATDMAHHTGFLIHALMRIEQGETYRPGLRPEFYGHAMALAKATLAAHKTDATAQAVAECVQELRNIAAANRKDWECSMDEFIDQFQPWAQSRARSTLAALEKE